MKSGKVHEIVGELFDAHEFKCKGSEDGSRLECTISNTLGANHLVNDLEVEVDKVDTNDVTSVNASADRFHGEPVSVEGRSSTGMVCGIALGNGKGSVALKCRDEGDVKRMRGSETTTEIFMEAVKERDLEYSVDGEGNIAV